jgi:chromosome segregation ATPase
MIPSEPTRNDMPTLEDRVTTLESRVDSLAAEVEHTSREARTSTQAHHKNIELLNALRATQAEHSRILAEHGGRLDSIDGRLDSIDGKLGQLTLGMHTIESLLRRVVSES